MFAWDALYLMNRDEGCHLLALGRVTRSLDCSPRCRLAEALLANKVSWPVSRFTAVLLVALIAFSVRVAVPVAVLCG